LGPAPARPRLSLRGGGAGFCEFMFEDASDAELTDAADWASLDRCGAGGAGGSGCAGAGIGAAGLVALSAAMLLSTSDAKLSDVER
jgi:hypothetical protein